MRGRNPGGLVKCVPSRRTPADIRVRKRLDEMRASAAASATVMKSWVSLSIFIPAVSCEKRAGMSHLSLAWESRHFWSKRLMGSEWRALDVAHGVRARSAASRVHEGRLSASDPGQAPSRRQLPQLTVRTDRVAGRSDLACCRGWSSSTRAPRRQIDDLRADSNVVGHAGQRRFEFAIGCSSVQRTRALPR